MAGLGHRVGPFELIERIASGRRTSLYRALRPDSSRAPRQVAVRMADDPDDAEIAEQIVAEYRVLREAADPRVPKVHGYYAGQAALAMTWVEGVTLTDVIVASRDGLINLDVATVADILVEIATGLRHAHAIQGLGRPVVHGHLGSQRVMLTPEGEIVLLGLGAVPHGRHIGYIAPEQASGAFQDWRADQWALGAIAVELLLGQRLYDGTGDPQQAAIVGDVRPWLAEVEVVAPELTRPLRRILATAAGNRYQQENTLIRELLFARRAIEGLGHKRAVARSVMAMQDRLSVQRPAIPAIQPRAERSDTQHGPAPVAPPSTPPQRRPPVVLVETIPDPPPPPVEDPAWVKPIAPFNPPRPRPLEVAPPPEPLSENPTLTPELEPEQEPTQPLNLRDLEPTEALEATEALEPTEMYSEDSDEDEPASPVAAILAALQPTEIAGMVLGLLFALLGVIYLFTRLWS